MLRNLHKVADGTPDILKKADRHNALSMPRLLADGAKLPTRKLKTYLLDESSGLEREHLVIRPDSSMEDWRAFFQLVADLKYKQKLMAVGGSNAATSQQRHLARFEASRAGVGLPPTILGLKVIRGFL